MTRRDHCSVLFVETWQVTGYCVRNVVFYYFFVLILTALSCQKYLNMFYCILYRCCGVVLNTAYLSTEYKPQYLTSRY